MIDVRELRIGNYVLYDGERSCIDKVSKDIIGIEDVMIDFDSMTSKTCTLHVGLEEVFPMPLTERLLSKCGFTKEAGGAFDASLDKSYDKYVGHVTLANIDGEYRIWNEAEDEWYSGGLFRPIKYMHQLQNTVFDLRGDFISF